MGLTFFFFSFFPCRAASSQQAAARSLGWRRCGGRHRSLGPCERDGQGGGGRRRHAVVGRRLPTVQHRPPQPARRGDRQRARATCCGRGRRCREPCGRSGHTSCAGAARPLVRHLRGGVKITQVCITCPGSRCAVVLSECCSLFPPEQSHGCDLFLDLMSLVVDNTSGVLFVVHESWSSWTSSITPLRFESRAWSRGVTSATVIPYKSSIVTRSGGSAGVSGHCFSSAVSQELPRR